MRGLCFVHHCSCAIFYGMCSVFSSSHMICPDFARQAVSIPHPDKKATGGEDAHFILDSTDRWAVGVADGVGGWTEIGVDSGIYSRFLMEQVSHHRSSRPDLSDASPFTQTKQALSSSTDPCPLKALHHGWIQAAQARAQRVRRGHTAAPLHPSPPTSTARLAAAAISRLRPRPQAPPLAPPHAV